MIVTTWNIKAISHTLQTIHANTRVKKPIKHNHFKNMRRHLPSIHQKPSRILQFILSTHWKKYSVKLVHYTTDTTEALIMRVEIIVEN